MNIVLDRQVGDPRLYILLPVHNRRDITARFIACLKEQSFQDFHLVLIDDGSTDGTAEMVGESIQSLTVLRGKGSWWWGGSLHQGYNWIKKHAKASGRAVMIINDDTRVEDDFLETGLRLLEGRERTLIGSACYSMQSEKLMDAGVSIDWSTLAIVPAVKPEEINCLSTRGLFLHMKDFLELGGFHPVLVPHYLSDYEYTVRAYNRGFKLRAPIELKIWDDETTTGIRKFQGSRLKQFYTRYFSKRSTHNLAAWLGFIWLVCPSPYKFKNLWAMTGKKFVTNPVRFVLMKLFVSRLINRMGPNPPLRKFVKSWAFILRLGGQKPSLKGLVLQHLRKYGQMKEIKVKHSGYVEVPRMENPEGGNLSFMEGNRHIPFDIKRVYFINQLENAVNTRGKHAHRETEQVIFCVQGDFMLDLDDGETTQTIRMVKDNVGVLLGAKLWHSMRAFSRDCVMLVIASAPYEEADYIRDYDEFRRYVGAKQA